MTDTPVPLSPAEERDAPRLTKLIVNLIPKSMDALKAAAEQNGDTRTDTVNRALQLYAYLTNVRAEGWDIRLSRRAPGVLGRLFGVRETVQIWWESNDKEIPE